jgi:ferrous iron transport protein A
MSQTWFGKLFGSKKDVCTCGTTCRKLSEAPTGNKFQVECLHGEEGTCQRLREMGFCESSIVEKVAQSGALICKVCDSKIVISKKLAENIIVKDVCQLKGHSSSEHSKKTLLSQMSLGQRGIIDDFVVASDDCERIEEMGLTPGEEVEIIRYAPLGDPIEIKVRGYSLSLRKQEADLIRVTLLS